MVRSGLRGRHPDAAGRLADQLVAGRAGALLGWVPLMGLVGFLGIAAGDQLKLSLFSRLLHRTRHVFQAHSAARPLPL